MDQSKLENTCNRRQAREDACEQVTVEKGACFFLTNHRALTAVKREKFSKNKKNTDGLLTPFVEAILSG